MYYFFVLSYLNYNIQKKRSFYLKLPFFTSLVVHLFLLVHRLFLFNYFETSISIKHAFYYAEEYFSIIFTIYLLRKTFKIITKYKTQNSKFTHSHVSINTNWLKQLLSFGLLICVFWFIIIFYNQYSTNSIFNNNGKYFLWISMSILIYWLGYLGVYHSGIFAQRRKIRINNLKDKSLFNKSNLNISRFEEIDSAIKGNKMYLNPNLSLDLLSDDFNLSAGYISQLVNKFSKTNFSRYINVLRVKDAKVMLTNKEYRNYTIIAIALEAGFNSKSAFYSTFKKEVGISPTEYQAKKMS